MLALQLEDVHIHDPDRFHMIQTIRISALTLFLIFSGNAIAGWDELGSKPVSKNQGIKPYFFLCWISKNQGLILNLSRR
jgi:hypothetical protein